MVRRCRCILWLFVGYLATIPGRAHSGSDVPDSLASPAPTLMSVATGADSSSTPQESADTASPAPTARATARSRQQDDKRPEEQLTIMLFGRPLVIGGEYELKPRYREDFALDRKQDDLARVDQRLEIELLYPLSDKVTAFLEGRASYRAEVYAENRKTGSERALERGETWLYLDDLAESNVSLQVGRQNFQDTREWWWDADLDAIRLHYRDDPMHLEVGLAQELTQVSTTDDDIAPSAEDVLRIVGRATWKWGHKQRLAAFFLVQNDHSRSPQLGETVDVRREDEVDADLTWVGIRSMGRWKLGAPGRLYYWADTGYVTGKETVIDFAEPDGGQSMVTGRFSRDVNGWAVDGGVTWETKLPLRPRLTAGLAIGSGDRHPDSEADHSFRQTGLQRNDGRWGGVDRFRYYGELLDPELSNLRIGTLALGMPLFRDSSVELIYHDYRQVHPQPALRDARLKTQPTGKDDDIGQEIDLVVGLEEWLHLEIEAVAALFRAGDAFGSEAGETASNLVLKVNYNF